jgi:hypothetical protein
VVSVEYWGKDTHHTGEGWEEALHRGVRNSILVDRMRKQEMVVGDIIMKDNVKCA